MSYFIMYFVSDDKNKGDQSMYVSPAEPVRKWLNGMGSDGPSFASQSTL